MRLAIQLAEQNVAQKHLQPFGAVVVRDGKVIAKSANKVVAQNDPTAHAEVSAIRLACKKLKTFDLAGAIIYTSCEPCPMCLSAIYWANISTIYYGNTKKDAADVGFDDHFLYQELIKPHSERQIPIHQLLRNEAQPAFQQWQKMALTKP